jgi:hypothetical protein
MVQYDIKRGWSANIEGDNLEKMMKEIFGNCRKEGNMLVSKFGVLERIEAEITGKNLLRVETANKDGPKADKDILDSKRKLNLFVEKATGFDAKARLKRAQDKAKKGEA